MNSRQSVVGFDFQRYNRDFLGRVQGGNGDASQRVNDATNYEVRIIPAQVAPGQDYWRVVGVRHLLPEENTGKHNLYAEILDEEGRRVRDTNVQLQRGWEGQHSDESAPLVRFDKGDNEPATNVPIDRNQKLWVSVASDLPSDRVENLHTKHPDEPGPNGELWNSIGHHSFFVVFQRTRHTGASVPIVTLPTEKPTERPTEKPAERPAEKPIVVPPVVATTRGDDATYIDGRDAIPTLATVVPGQRFHQTWVVLNSGSTEWGNGYRVVNVGGHTLGAPAHVLTPFCAPGDAIGVTVPFVAPDASGPHYSVWRLANERGETFGERLWLVINVATGNVATGRERSSEAIAANAEQPGERNVRPATQVREPAPAEPLPATGVESGGTPPAARDPELYAVWKQHVENGFANNQLLFQQLLEGFLNPYWTTVWMYRILFGLGVASFLVAVALSAFTDKEGFTLIFGGLSALSLLAFFFNRPLQALEENLQFITWLGLIYNSYWTRLLYLNSQPDAQEQLQDATDDAIKRIKELIAAHSKRSALRERLVQDAKTGE